MTASVIKFVSLETSELQGATAEVILVPLAIDLSIFTYYFLYSLSLQKSRGLSTFINSRESSLSPASSYA